MARTQLVALLFLFLLVNFSNFESQIVFGQRPSPTPQVSPSPGATPRAITISFTVGIASALTAVAGGTPGRHETSD